MTFEVAPADAQRGAILYFRPFNPLNIYDPIELVGDEEISTNELAWRLSGKPRQKGKNPPGASTRLAEQLRDQWEQEGRVEVLKGPRKSQMLRLRTNLASSPQPSRARSAQSGNLTSPTAPIEARGGSEVKRGSRANGGAGSEGKVSDGESKDPTPSGGPLKKRGRHNASFAVAGASPIKPSVRKRRPGTSV